jgi:prophage antirepressor-like protein
LSGAFQPNLQWVLLYQEAFETFAAATSFETDRSGDAGASATVPTVETVGATDEAPKPGTEVAKIQLFDFEGKDVQVQDQDGNAWFVLNDVCKVLEIVNPRDAATRLDDDEKAAVGIADVSSNGVSQRRSVTVINESGVNALIMTSRKPEAKRFRKWVTGTVLPSIRKHGAYIGGQEEMTDTELMAKALLSAHRIGEERAKRIGALEVENATLAAEAATLGAKVERLATKAAGFGPKRIGVCIGAPPTVLQVADRRSLFSDPPASLVASPSVPGVSESVSVRSTMHRKLPIDQTFPAMHAYRSPYLSSYWVPPDHGPELVHMRFSNGAVISTSY